MPVGVALSSLNGLSSISFSPDGVCDAQDPRNSPDNPVRFEVSRHQYIDPEPEEFHKQVKLPLGSIPSFGLSLPRTNQAPPSCSFHIHLITDHEYFVQLIPGADRTVELG